MTYAFQLLLLAALHGPTATPVWTAVTAPEDASGHVSSTIEADSDFGVATEKQDSDDDDQRDAEAALDTSGAFARAVVHHAGRVRTARWDAVAAHAPRGPPTA